MSKKSKSKKSGSLELRYIKIFPILMILCGLFVLYTNFVTGITFSIVTAFLFFPIAFIMLTRSVVTLTPKSIVLKNIFGQQVKTIPINKRDIEVRKNQVFIAGEPALSLWMYDKNSQDLESFAQS